MPTDFQLRKYPISKESETLTPRCEMATTMTYAQLAASLAKTLAQSLVSPATTRENDAREISVASNVIPTSEFHSEKKRGIGNGMRDDGIQSKEDADAESDIASSRAQSPLPHDEQSQPKSASVSSLSLSSTLSPPAQIAAPPQPVNDMSDEQLYQAKVLVLDLLGWGVPPEYLLQRGVSHELIYTVFTDLKLRLPENIAADYAAIMGARGLL